MKASKPYSGLPIKVLVIILTGILTSNLAKAQSWYNSGWLYRLPITISNTGATLADYQVQVSLDASFPWSHIKIDGSDIRFTSPDGETELSYWIESWTAGTSASIWVKVPFVAPTPEITSIYLYYGNPLANSAASGDNTFEFFDDFETPSIITSGYYTLSSPGTTILVQDQIWENSAPHTLDVVDWGYEKEGYRYWGYYGLQAYPQGGGVGLARSNDLATWTKYESNPVINVTNARWPSVYLEGTVVHLFYTDYTEGNSTIVRETSSDGITFTTNKTLVVPSEAGIYNGSPDLFIDPIDGTYYLYWVRIIGSAHEIMARSASTIDGLSSAVNITVMTSAATLAAPDMMYRDGNYFLTCEVIPSVWATNAYVSTSPVSGFAPVTGNPIVGDGSACYSQHIFGNTLHAYYAKLTGSIWTMEYRHADLTQGLSQAEVPDITKWTPSGGTWDIATATQENGSEGKVVHGITTAFQILRSSFSGNDYILEASGYQISGNEWGLGFRVENNQNYFTANLYQNLDDLYLYNWINGGATAVTNVDAGTVDPGTWYKMTVKAHGDYFDVYVDGINRISNAFSDSHPSGGIALFGEGTQNVATNAYFNDVRVRKYTSNEPGITIGTTEEVLFRWDGGLNTDWNNSGNWSSGITPTSGDDITIPDATNDPTISGNAICGNLIIEPSAGLAIQTGAALTINGDLTNSGILAVNSTLASSGSLIVSGTSIGNITYNRQLKPGTDSASDWHLAATPVAANSNTNPGKISTVYQWSEPAGSWATTNIVSALAGHGYNIRQETVSDGVISFTGPLVNNDVNVAASSPYADAVGPGDNYFDRSYVAGRSLANMGGKGWNLLGNPYPSAISASAFIDANYSATPSLSQFDPNYVALYLFDGAARRYYYIAKSTGWPSGLELSATHIQAGQGFFVLAMNDNSEFRFTRAMQEHSTGTAMLKSQGGSDDRWPGLQLKVKHSAGEVITTVVYSASMTTGVDPGYDIGIFKSGQEIEIYTTLAVKDNGVNYTRQAVPISGVDTLHIPVGIDLKTGGEVTFSANSVPVEGRRFWLEDRTTGIFTDLSLKSYTVILPNETYGTGRFFIIASANTPTAIRPPQLTEGDLRMWVHDSKLIISGVVSGASLCELFDLQGKNLMQNYLTDGAMNTVDLPAGLRGIVVIRVTDGQKVVNRKLILP